jgi:hypothetical protein
MPKETENLLHKGREKGSKKKAIEIRDSCMDPFYIVVEDRQYVKMEEGNHISQGYFTTLTNALNSILKELLVRKKAGSTLTLSQYINEYQQLQNKILNTINI